MITATKNIIHAHLFITTSKNAELKLQWTSTILICISLHQFYSQHAHKSIQTLALGAHGLVAGELQMDDNM